MARLLAILVTVLALTGPAWAQPVEGRWALRAAEGTFAILEVDRDSAAPGGWRVTWSQPKGSSFDSGGGTSGLGGPVEARSYRATKATSDALGLVDAKAPEGAPTGMTLTALGPDTVLLRFEGAPLQLLFDRARSGEQVTTEWVRREARLIQTWPDNAEIAALFAADQAARTGEGPIDWAKVEKEDAARRYRVAALLDAGALRSGNDFWHAAFIYQHGNKPEDYMKAHALAIAAAGRGRSDGAWIAAASLDRWLQATGKPQIFGTQFKMAEGAMTQEPYDRALVSDGMRAAANVPPIADQRKTIEQAMKPQKP